MNDSVSSASRWWAFRASAVAAIALAGSALAAVQESTTFLAVNSQGAFNAADNDVRTATFTGGYAVRTIHVTGTLTRVHSSSNQHEARILVTPPSGPSFVIQTSRRTTFASPVTFDGYAFPLPSRVADAAGEWAFRFYESTANASGTPDATWDSIQISLDDEVAFSAGSLTLTPDFTGLYTEIEPNDDMFVNVNVIRGMQDGERVFWITTGSSTSSPGNGSADQFAIMPALDAPGIYRYQLATVRAGTAAIPANAGRLHGASQTTDLGAGMPGLIIVGGSGTDGPALQLALNSTPQINQWYGFGKGELVYFRGTGAPILAATNFTATLQRTTITPTPASATLVSGPVTLARTNGGNWDMWLYDSEFNAIPGAGFEGAGTLTRTLASGTYYVAATDPGAANSQASPADSAVRNGAVNAGPGDAIMHTLNGSNVNMNMTFSHAGGQATATGTKVGALDVVWYQLRVSDLPVADAGPDRTVNDADSSGFELVTLDGSASSDSDGTIVNYRWSEGGSPLSEGPSPLADVFLSLGVHVITLDVTDDAGLTATDTVVITVEQQPPPGCPADFNGDTFVNPDDLADFITCFFLDIQFPGFCPQADFNADTSRDPDDLADFITTFFLAVQFGC